MESTKLSLLSPTTKHPRPECPICMIPLPYLEEESAYMPCCGKIICNGCSVAKRRALVVPTVPPSIEKGDNNKMAENKMVESNEFVLMASTSDDLCPFCRAGLPESYTKALKLIRFRIKKHKDTKAMNHLAYFYEKGLYGLTTSRKKAVELFKRSYDLGNLDAALLLTKIDPDNKFEYITEASKLGHMDADFFVGMHFYESENFEKSVQHLIKATRAGNGSCMKELMSLYRKGILSKDDLASTLRAHQAIVDATKSEAREYAERFRRYVQSSNPTLLN